MQQDLAPPVVAVVVTNDPGPWLESCLESLFAQDYTNLSVLVIDAGSSFELAERVAAITPSAFLWRTEENKGYGPSANHALELVEGASFYLHCHDDVVMLHPHAIAAMVEEAFRSNAGIVGPKLVDALAPDRILQLGLGVDHLGAPIRRTEHRELDQAQHDEATEVFATPGGCTLVRADLFAALGGFDPEISLFGEDVDLCWRARIAGARVVVEPSATVAHLEATASRKRQRPDARALQWRHELRVVLKNYASSRRLVALFQLALYSMAEIVYFVVIGKPWRARQVYGAWRWNLSPARHLKEARAAVAASRRSPERDVCALLTRRTSRAWRFAHSRVERAALQRRPAARRQSLEGVHTAQHGPPAHRQRRPRAVIFGAVILTIVVLFGLRSLLTGGLPLVGGLAPVPSGTSLLAHYFGGWTDAGLQHPGPASPAFALLGVASGILFGGNGLLLVLELVASALLGAFGVARLLRPFAAPVGRLVGAVGYLFLPLFANDIARGDLQALYVFAGIPWVIALLTRAGREGTASPAFQCLRLGLVLGLVAAFAPVAVLLELACGVAYALGGLLFGELVAGLRVLVVTIGAAVVAFVLLFPWSLTFVQRGVRWSVLVGVSSNSPTGSPSLSEVLRFAFGPTGHGMFSWALLFGAGLVLLIGRKERLLLGGRLWLCALGFFALTWAGAEGWLGSGGGALSLLAAPAAVCIAAALGLGAASIVEDLPHSGLGWRHVTAIVFALFAVVGLFPVFGATLGGRFSLASSGYDTVLSWMGAPAAQPTTRGAKVAATGRVLWLGDPDALPLPGWQLEPGLAAAVSSGGLPDATRLFLSPNPGLATAIMSAVTQAESGATIQLGHLLAPYGIRYIVVPTADAPLLGIAQHAPRAEPPAGLLTALGAQGDLHALPSGGGALVFLDAQWRPGTDVAPALAATSGSTTPSSLRSLGIAFEIAAWIACAVALWRRRRERQERERATRRLALAHAVGGGGGTDPADGAGAVLAGGAPDGALDSFAVAVAVGGGRVGRDVGDEATLASGTAP